MSVPVNSPFLIDQSDHLLPEMDSKTHRQAENAIESDPAEEFRARLHAILTDMVLKLEKLSAEVLPAEEANQHHDGQTQNSIHEGDEFTSDLACG